MIDGNEIWESLFGILKGDVPEALSEFALSELANDINRHFREEIVSRVSEEADDAYAQAREDLDGNSEERRVSEMRSDIYRAIYAGDLERAEDAINLMSMVDIDRELIWAARKGVRCDG